MPTDHNPADIVSRGCDVRELKQSIWFEGPSLLLNDSASWPVNKHFELTENQISFEKRKTNVFLAVEDPQNCLLDLMEKYCSYKKLLRVTAFVVRFFDILRKRRVEKNCPPTAVELKLAFFRHVETIQKMEFSEEILRLQKSLVLHSNIQRLTPFIHTFVEESNRFH